MNIKLVDVVILLIQLARIILHLVAQPGNTGQAEMLHRIIIVQNVVVVQVMNIKLVDVVILIIQLARIVI
jgi:hypothetical protein